MFSAVIYASGGFFRLFMCSMGKAKTGAIFVSLVVLTVFSIFCVLVLESLFEGFYPFSIALSTFEYLRDESKARSNRL